MRSACRFILSLLLVGCPVLARAVTIRIQDPNYTNVTTTPYSFTFTACPGPNDPGGQYLDNGVPITSQGCFGGVNETNAAITSITLTFDDNAALDNSGVDSASSDIFADSTVISPTGPDGQYTFVFSGSQLAKGETFVITEDGVADPTQIPMVSLAYTVTPEPWTLLLMATGLLFVGGLYRRRAHQA